MSVAELSVTDADGLRRLLDLGGFPEPWLSGSVDFVVTDRSGPTHLIEVKWSDRPVDKSLRYLRARFPDAAAIQISATGTDDYRTPDGIRVQPALAFLQSLV